MPLQPPNVLLNQALTFYPIGDHNRATQTTVAQTLTPPAGADKIMLQVTGTLDVRYIVGGTVAPTTASGFHIETDAAPIIIPVGLGTNLVVIGESDAADTIFEYMWGGTHRG